jgi:hypothetical protein
VLKPLTKAPDESTSPADEERDRFIYTEAMKGEKWVVVLAKVNAQAPPWNPIATDEGVRDRARAYAERHGLQSIPPRKRGRKANPRNTN